jgi:hypothetical protein
MTMIIIRAKLRTKVRERAREKAKPEFENSASKELLKPVNSVTEVLSKET